jgi:hypothetical protein
LSGRHDGPVQSLREESSGPVLQARQLNQMIQSHFLPI